MVNPYEMGKVADYLHNALEMTPAEAEVRMNSLRYILEQVGPGWNRLEKVGAGWNRLEHIGAGWNRL